MQPASAWAPLAISTYRTLWLAQLGSTVGIWMQSVGAQWVMVERNEGSTVIALVQTAAMAPVFLLALPSGVLADVLDRRRMLILVQAFLVAVAAALAGLVAVGQSSPAVILVFTFLVGAGMTMGVPAWQALIPDLVPRPLLRSASALGAVSVNLARAVGPAVAGLLLSSVSTAAVFAVSCALFAVLPVMLTVTRAGGAAPEVPERFTPALRAGGRYVANSPVVRRILLRAALFVIPGAAVWALLPVVAAHRLSMGASGYGVLLAALGCGAIVGAFLLPRITARTNSNTMVAIASCVYAVAGLVTGLSTNAVVVVVVLLPAGFAWLTVLASLNASMQMFLPGWVRARGLATFQVVFIGGQSLSSFAWGFVAEQAGLQATFVASAAVMLASAATVRALPLHDTEGLDRSPSMQWPEPHVTIEPDPEDGPVVITVRYTVAPEAAAEFVAAMDAVGRSRRRTGAVQWGLFRDSVLTDRFLEIYLVPSWGEHLRQHTIRQTGADREVGERAKRFSRGGVEEIVHLLPARSGLDG